MIFSSPNRWLRARYYVFRRTSKYRQDEEGGKKGKKNHIRKAHKAKLSCLWTIAQQCLSVLSFAST